MTDTTTPCLVDTLRALPAEALAQAYLEVDDVLPDVRDALVALSRGDAELAAAHLTVTVRHLEARHEAITTAIAANATAAQQN